MDQISYKIFYIGLSGIISTPNPHSFLVNIKLTIIELWLQLHKLVSLNGQAKSHFWTFLFIYFPFFFKNYCVVIFYHLEIVNLWSKEA